MSGETSQMTATQFQGCPAGPGGRSGGVKQGDRMTTGRPLPCRCTTEMERERLGPARGILVAAGLSAFGWGVVAVVASRLW